MDRSLSSFHELLLDKGVAFVRYKLPDQESVTLVSFSPKHFDSLEFLKDEDLEGFVFAPFKADALHPIWFLSGDEIIKEGCNIEALINRVSEMPSSTIKSTSRSSSTTKLDYSKAFEKFRSEIIKEKLDKAILSKLVVEDRGEASLIHLFSELSSTYSKAFTYFIHLPNGESWMGASPELLLQQDKISMRTMALAGTQLVENRKIEDISWENKEREEQAYVKKYIHDIFLSLGEEVNISETYTAQAGNLAHLRNDFTVKGIFKRKTVIELINKLHPTPAVCGIPLQQAQSLIFSTEKHSRDYYTGFMGFINKYSLTLYVNLRCMQIFDTNYTLYVGGGITKDSDPEKEWIETENKAQTLLEVIKRI